MRAELPTREQSSRVDNAITTFGRGTAGTTECVEFYQDSTDTDDSSQPKMLHAAYDRGEMPDPATPLEDIYAAHSTDDTSRTYPDDEPSKDLDLGNHPNPEGPKDGA